MPEFDACCDPAELLDLSGRKGLVVGIANDRSLAWPAALHFRQAGAELAITYVDERTKPHVVPLAARLEAPILLPCDVNAPHELDAVFDAITDRWGKLDFILHAVGSVPPGDLHGRLTDCSAAGFSQAMHVSVHSLIRMAHLAEPLMKSGGSLITLSYLGGERVVENYNVMGPVKAALEATVRYLAHELGPSNIRVNAISAGPVMTRAASGLTGFAGLLDATARVAPLRRNVTADEVGRAALLFASDYTGGITGEVLHVDAGVHVESPVAAAKMNVKSEEIMMRQTIDETNQLPATERRDFLYYATASTGAIAAGAAVWPLINSMNPSADVTASGTVRVDLSGVEPGQRITVKWQGHPVFVWRRSEAAIQAARAVDLDQLPDPVDEAGENPNTSGEEPALDENRAAGEDGEWLVVIGVCTHLGCIPLGQDGSAVGEFGGWFCPCHGSHYDTSGRIRKGPAPRNLDIPPYDLGDDLQLVIGT